MAETILTSTRYGNRHKPMGEWKAHLSLRIRQALRTDLEEVAARERRTLGNLGVVLIEWAFEQLKMAGSVNRLLDCKLSKRNEDVE